MIKDVSLITYFTGAESEREGRKQLAESAFLFPRMTRNVEIRHIKMGRDAGFWGLKMTVIFDCRILSL